jgi:hypothetical protein
MTDYCPQSDGDSTQLPHCLISSYCCVDTVTAPVCVTTFTHSLLLTLPFIYVMGGECSTCGGEEKRLQGIGGET